MKNLPVNIVVASQYLLFIFFNFFNVYFWERERERQRETEREGDTESEAGSRLQAVSTDPNVGLEATNHEIVT